ncbi:RDD family protein [Phytoactinopolyspora halotolerans]|uniref:RDD family protein n=1 Tax=Phytoactinopolyspora halotolerans TaxID=1981512 RepID=A0A6L9S8J2_9ACTN|nr:RDD family protein [Phytoactinopolyspora halotolerans]NEE01011.1 RDD family protein [Phytoactinopolyspora halotolerans]
MNELAARRFKAYARDCIGYAAIAAATAPLGVAMRNAGRGRSRAFVLAVSAVPPILATLRAARQESTSGATEGKRHYGLHVTNPHHGVPSFGRALIRNAIKIGIPWQTGHVVAVGAAFGGFERRDPLTVSAAAVTYPMIGVLAAGVAVGSGRGIHDRAARTRVRSVR